MARSWPHVANERLAILVFHPIVACRSLVIDEIALLCLDSRVDHIHRLEMLLMEVVVELFGMSELLGVEGEDAIPVHIVYVHPYHVGRNFQFPQLVGNLHHLCVGLITEPALLVAQRPQGWQGHGACEFHQRLHEHPWTLTLDDHNPECRTNTLENDLVVGCSDGLPPCVVGDDAKSRTIGSHAHHPGMTLVEVRTTIHAISWSVHIP